MLRDPIPWPADLRPMDRRSAPSGSAMTKARIIRQCVVVAAILALLGTLSTHATAQEPPDVTFRTSLTGRVLVEGSDHPIPGASVSIELQGREVAHGTTDANGHFHIEGEFLAGGAPEVARVSAVGYLPLTHRVVLLCHGTSVRDQGVAYCRRELTPRLQEAHGLFEPSASRCTQPSCSVHAT
jgi:hypothetical protein